jgi:hypothetical protein
MKRTLNYMTLIATIAASPLAIAEESSCYDRSVAVTKMVTAQPENVLEIVGREVAATPLCSCEIVKAAIVATEAERELVAQIVATAVDAAPEKMRIIGQCAIAVAPDALPNVMKILAKLDPAKGDGYSEKGVIEQGSLDKGKEVVVAPGLPSPLDGPYLVPGEPPLHPNFDTPDDITDAGGFDDGDEYYYYYYYDQFEGSETR